jgi:hypothetical protein
LGGKATFPICPECDADALQEVVIHCAKSRHLVLANFNLPLVDERAEGYGRR